MQLVELQEISVALDEQGIALFAISYDSIDALIAFGTSHAIAIRCCRTRAAMSSAHWVCSTNILTSTMPNLAEPSATTSAASATRACSCWTSKAS